MRKLWYDFTFWLEFQPWWNWLQAYRYAQHNRRVIADFEHRMACVLTTCTKTMSKPYYHFEDMRVEIEDYIQEQRDEAYAEGREEHAQIHCTGGLTFDTLRAASLLRQSKYPCDGWSLSDWLVAIMGELGEAANVIKKVNRGDFTMAQAAPALAKEFADVQIYLDIIAGKCAFDLGQITVDKWNEVSARLGYEARIIVDPPERDE